eukprot:TRINITY_DN2201_c0_g1_i5.p2 TRINITY_DN2201_c0_g1~~TRINITY_DN2201_c0_g1_i5.p2  ORF type:complete len:117 (-),score=2.82 TRINITY_DN2201_c0_g1_i5:255-605(-)
MRRASITPTRQIKPVGSNTMAKNHDSADHAWHRHWLDRRLFDTMDEISLLFLIFLTMGLVYVFGTKPNTDSSYIHSWFKCFDFFVTRDDEASGCPEPRSKDSQGRDQSRPLHPSSE